MLRETVAAPDQIWAGKMSISARASKIGGYDTKLFRPAGAPDAESSGSVVKNSNRKGKAPKKTKTSTSKKSESAAQFMNLT